MHSWALFLSGAMPAKNPLLSRGRWRCQVGHEAARHIHVRARTRAGCGAVAAGQSVRGEAGGCERHTSPPLHPWGSFPSPGGSERGSEGGTGCFFPPNARSTEAKEEKQPVGEQSLESSSSPRCKQRGPTHRALKATAVPSPQKNTAEGTGK